jgi:hypothetical protein
MPDVFSIKQLVNDRLAKKREVVHGKRKSEIVGYSQNIVLYVATS